MVGQKKITRDHPATFQMEEISVQRIIQRFCSFRFRAGGGSERVSRQFSFRNTIFFYRTRLRMFSVLDADLTFDDLLSRTLQQQQQQSTDGVGGEEAFARGSTRQDPRTSHEVSPPPPSCDPRAVPHRRQQPLRATNVAIGRVRVHRHDAAADDDDVGDDTEATTAMVQRGADDHQSAVASADGGHDSLTNLPPVVVMVRTTGDAIRSFRSRSPTRKALIAERFRRRVEAPPSGVEAIDRHVQPSITLAPTSLKGTSPPASLNQSSPSAVVATWLTAVVAGMRVRSLFQSSKIVATLVGQIQESATLIADLAAQEATAAQHPGSSGAFSARAMRVQRRAWVLQLIDFTRLQRSLAVTVAAEDLRIRESAADDGAAAAQGRLTLVPIHWRKLWGRFDLSRKRHASSATARRGPSTGSGGSVTATASSERQSSTQSEVITSLEELPVVHERMDITDSADGGPRTHPAVARKMLKRGSGLRRFYGDAVDDPAAHVQAGGVLLPAVRRHSQPPPEATTAAAPGTRKRGAQLTGGEDQHTDHSSTSRERSPVPLRPQVEAVEGDVLPRPRDPPAPFAQKSRNLASGQLNVSSLRDAVVQRGAFDSVAATAVPVTPSSELASPLSIVGDLPLPLQRILLSASEAGVDAVVDRHALLRKSMKLPQSHSDNAADLGRGRLRCLLPSADGALRVVQSTARTRAAFSNFVEGLVALL